MGEKAFDPCCGCIKLRTGCLIVGYLRLVVEITLDCYMVTMKIPGWVEELKEVPGEFRYFLIFLGVITLLYLAVSILGCILLLVEVHLNRHGYVPVYIRHARCCIYITTAFCAQKLICPTTSQDFPLFCISFILLLLQGYFLLVIYWYHKSTNEKPQPVTTTSTLQQC